MKLNNVSAKSSQVNTILVFSQRGDVTTDKVISWLIFFGAKTERVNCDEKCTALYISQAGDLSITIDSKLIKLIDYDSIWIRRGYISVDESFTYYDRYEARALEQFINFSIETNPKSIGTLTGERNHNKFEDLTIARGVGLKIPDSWVISTRQEFEAISSLSSDEFITKALHNNYWIKEGNGHFKCGDPAIVNPELIPNQFLPSLIQKRIKKKIDLRVFFFKHKFYSLAIFSQKNPKTKLTYKNYSKSNPNRIVPYKLPKVISDKLNNLVKILKLDSCSIDLILSNSNEYYFLEINRQGQIDWLSESCNYAVEKEIANFLAKKNK